MILPVSTVQSFAAALASATGEPLGRVAYDHFPDGELVLEIEAVDEDGFPADDGRAIVVAATTTSDAHIECLQLQDAARQAGASEVITVIPYMGYADRDEALEDWQPISSATAAKAISTGTDRVITVNPHEESFLDFYDVPATSVDAAGRLAKPLPADLEDPLFLGVDEDTLPLARPVREAYEGGRGALDHLEPPAATGSDGIAPAVEPVSGRDVVMVDDIIATGTTMTNAVEAATRLGAARVYAVCVHPLAAGNAVTRLSAAGVERIYGTDTIERAVSGVSAAPAVADVL